MQNNPVSKYQAPAATMGRGRNRHDANTPRLKVICHNPGSIQSADGTYANSTKVRSAPAPAEGRNCSAAMRIISSAMPEWMRRVRAYIWVAISDADTIAVEIQIAM